MSEEQKTKHTAEPWKAFDSDDDAYIDKVMHCHSGEGWAYFIDKVDVLRIVACVNACAGIETESLESFAGQLSQRSAVSLWINYCDLKQQNAELLADAIRYRYIRSIGEDQQRIMAHYGLEELDRKVDEAIAKAGDV